MLKEEKQKLQRFYNDRYDQFGQDIRSVGWSSAESQELRFKILTEIDDLSGASVCDLGCGFGDLYPFLMKRFSGVSYGGIDISEKLLAEAQRRYPEASFELGDVLEDRRRQTFDYVLASGALSYKMTGHDDYVRSMLQQMWAMTRKGVAVNFLSTYVDFQLEKNFHLSPLRALEWGRELTRYVTIRHDYPLYEFTMYLYREAKT